MSDAVWEPGTVPLQSVDPVVRLEPVRHKYPLAVRDHGLMTAIGLMLKSLPYALARFGLELAFTTGCIVWMVITFGGTAWLSAHIAGAFGFVWFIGCVVGAGWFWFGLLRYAMHLITCGHVAVLTELITRGQVGNGSESMFAYGKRVVTEKFGTVNVLFAMNALVRGVLDSFHRTLDWIAESMPIPGMEGLANLVTIVLKAATRYLDKVIFSYTQEGIVYYCQDAKPILKTSVWIVIQERVLSFCLWVALLVPAGMITVILPKSVRESGAVVNVIIAILLAAAIRSSFLKPIFLIMTMIRFHTLIENQPINEEWAARLAGMSDKFGNFNAATALASRRFF
jgi:hypothetical protein